MATPLLQTKLYIPPLRPELVPRPRLIEQLNAGLHRKLTLISAPAGFGKTTLLSEWAVDCRRPVTWLSLDEGDNDPARFLAYFIAALQMVEENIGEGILGALQSPQPPPIEAILTSLINEIAAIPNGFTLVLDDYHLIKAQPIHDALTFLLDHLPPPMHLVIGTRQDPPLPLARLRGRGRMMEIRAGDLRFTEEEATAFLNQAMGLGLTPDEVAALEARTEGWIAGLHLAALSLKGQADRAAFIQAFAGDDRHVMDYLVSEVVSRQSEAAQRFLLHTAILERLCGPLCDAVVGSDGQPGSSQAILEYLERANLFIVPLDNRRQWYRYHHLFAGLLRHRLRRTVGAQGLAPLHHRASQWYEGNGFIPEAVSHALAAEDFEGAVRLVEQSAMQMFVRSELATILRWVDALPDDLVRARPWLCVFYAWALRLSGGEFGAVESRLRDAERALAKRARLPSQADQVEGAALPEVETHSVLGHIAALRAYQALYREEIPRTIELARQSLEQLSEENFVRGLSALALGWASRFNGDLVGASQAFTEARTASLASGNIYVAVAATCRLAYTQALGGQLHWAVESCRQALQMATRKDGRRLPVAGYAYVYMGGVYREWNDLEAAARYLVEGIDLCRQVGYIMDQVVGYATLARVRQAQSDRNGARDALQNAEQLSQKMKGYVYARRWVEDCQVRLWLAQQDLAAAARWAQGSGLSVDDEINFLRELEHIILARVLVAQGQEQPEGAYLADALDLLARLLEAAETAGWIGKAIEILALQAVALQAQGDTDQALVALGRALTLAEPEGYVRLFVDEGPPMTRLLLEAAARGIMPDYARRLLAVFETEAKDEEPALRRPPSVSRDEAEGLVEPLSERELEILQLIAEGLTNQEIASRLFLALNTVKVHTRNIYGKLGVNSRTQAVAKARALGILPFI
jgi:LuxR family maltose regulon positive regulatory protein